MQLLIIILIGIFTSVIGNKIYDLLRNYKQPTQKSELEDGTATKQATPRPPTGCNSKADHASAEAIGRVSAVEGNKLIRPFPHLTPDAGDTQPRDFMADHPPNTGWLPLALCGGGGLQSKSPPGRG